jgi:hypothetical protein
MPEKKVIVIVLAPLMGGVPVCDPNDDGGEHPLPVLTTCTPGGYGLTTKEKRSSGHVTWLCVGEPCDPTIIFKNRLFRTPTSVPDRPYISLFI